MDNLPIQITRETYSYDSTYRNVFNKVMVQLKVHFFIYNCNLCCKPWNSCYCWCPVCKTYLKFCHQIFYDENSTYEDDVPDIIPLGFLI